MSAAVSPELRGMYRSLRTYHGDRSRALSMDRLYARFVSNGDLVFDVGAHVGDRVSAFRRLGARVVAVEPQPLAMRALRLIHGRDAQVSLVAAAVGRAACHIELKINSANPTVSTASGAFVAAAAGAGGWEGQIWDRSITVAGTTLDELIAAHGTPAFIKIDVEGYEDAVLAGLSTPVAGLSFEFTTIARDVARRCLTWLSELGPYAFNVALGESQQLGGRWIDRDAMSAHLDALPHQANSGDVYAVLEALRPD